MAYYLDFAVFYNCIIKDHTTRTQHDAVNMLLRGFFTGDCETFSDTKCSRYVSGNRKIATEEIAEVFKNDKEEICRRMKALSIQSVACLDTFSFLIKTKQILLDNDTADRFLQSPKNYTELMALLADIFLHALECPSHGIRELSKTDLARLRISSPASQSSETPAPETPDTENAFLHNYKKPLFWSDSEGNSLKNLYIYNSYSFKQHTRSHNDLDVLIDRFLNNRMDEFLRNTKNICQYTPIQILLISGFPGCGKTSLVSRIAHDYAHMSNIIFVNMATIKDSDISLATLSAKSGVPVSKLKDKILVLDSLDEAIKHSENCDDALSNLCDELAEHNCHAVVTCRTNLLNSDDIRSCFEITLDGFNEEKAIEWLHKYKTINSDFNIDPWERTIQRLSPSLARILLIPLILYICVIRQIDITTIKDIGQLYDILFDPVYSQIANTSHREHFTYKNSEWKVLREKVSDIAIKMFQQGYVHKDMIEASDVQGLKKYFGLDFYVDSVSVQVCFAHTSIWQYFVAEQIYRTLKLLTTKEDTHFFIEQMLKIIVPEKTIDHLILTFIEYFFKRDQWIPADITVYKHVLLHLPEYSAKMQGNSLVWLSSIWRDLFKIFTKIFTCYYPKSRDTFFQELSTDENKTVLVNTSNLTMFSPLMNVSDYRLKGIEINRINFCNSYMKYCSLRSSTFRNANFDYACLEGVYADNCNMNGSTFRNAYLNNAEFIGSSLVCCDFFKAHLNGADFTGADISYSDLRNATIYKTKFDCTKIQDCKISLEHLSIFPPELVQANHMKVYDKDNRLLSMEELFTHYYQNNQVRNAFRMFSKTIQK